MKTLNATVSNLSLNLGKAILTVTLFAALSGNALAEIINLNKADAETIEYIPGVGPSKAQKLVEVRSENGGRFANMDQIDAIPGFGERTMLDIKKHGSLKKGVSKMSKEMKANRPSRSVSTTIKTPKKKAS